MAKEDVEVSTIKRWGGKKEKEVPGFLLPKEERQKLLKKKLHSTGKPPQS